MSVLTDILIKNGRIWDGERFYRKDILIDKGKIVKIASKAEEKAKLIFDAVGKYVLPGMVDVHAHLLNFSSEVIGMQAEMGCFPFGVTAAADTEGCFGNKYLSELSSVKNVVFVGVRLNGSMPDWGYIGDRLDKLGDKAAGVKVFYDLTSDRGWNIELLKNVCDFAAEKGLKVMVHTTNSPSPMGDIVKLLKKGDILTHAFHGGVNNAEADGYICLTEAKQKGVIVDLGFEGKIHTDFNVFKNAVNHGVKPDTLGTDITCVSAYTLGGKYGMTMVMSVAKSLGMTEEEIFKAVTSSSAAALGKENEWGYIKVGRCADITVLDSQNEGFNLTDSFGNNKKTDTGYGCVLTIANGKVIYRR